MKSETRANLLFLVVLLAVTLPGAVMLFKKKLDPSAPPMYMPEAIRRRLPYMAPLPTPAEVTRFVPTLAGQWVARVGREQGDVAHVLEEGRHPVISEDRRVQVIAVKDGAATTTVYLIAWDKALGADAARYRADAIVGDRPAAARIVTARAIPMPQPVKRELMTGGFIQPPPTIAWIEVEIDRSDQERRPLTLNLMYNAGDATTSTSVNLFTYNAASD